MFCITKISKFHQNAIQYLHQSERDDNKSYRTFGGLLSDSNNAWLVNGARFEVISCKTGTKIGSWNFGGILHTNSTKVICVDEIQRPRGKVPLLAIAIECDVGGGMICIFDFVGSKVIRAIQVPEKITSLHVIDGGQDVFNLSGPLSNFDGILAVGTLTGNTYIVDICRQLCNDDFGTLNVRDELYPCQMVILTSSDMVNIEKHKRHAVKNGEHLAIYLNVVFNKETEHFVLKGPKGEDKLHVNLSEVAISALHYCPQLGSILVGYNFGAFQLWNLMNLKLVYTSPVCEDHVPITQFAIQEPSDDPRAFCYIWAVYSSDDLIQAPPPLAVMYAFCYGSKEYHQGYGTIYENFHYSAVRFQMELGFIDPQRAALEPKRAKCVRLDTLVHKTNVNRDMKSVQDGVEDISSLCCLVWMIYCKKETLCFTAIFDLNQWYKEQMPNTPNFEDCANYMIHICVSDLLKEDENCSRLHDLMINKKTLRQFVGTQRLEEHFCPSSLSFDTCCLEERRVLFFHFQGNQRTLLHQLESAGPLCLIRPSDIYQEIVSLGLAPLFVDIPVNAPISLNSQREIILNVALEHHLTGWLCKCASEWANGSFVSAGCSLDLLIGWAFQRSSVLKKNCDVFCVSLFDYSEVRLDTNTTNLLNNCIRQIKNICSFYTFVVNKLSAFITNKELVNDQYRFLRMTEVYFEVLQWLFNVGLLPECPLSAYPKTIETERISAPYPAKKLVEYYNQRRSELQHLHQGRFSSNQSLLFIDNLIDIECGGENLQRQWLNDGGTGLYPPNSLQALLRTYLVDNIDVNIKHAVIIYVFLDLAVNLVEDRYKPVVTHLIKFPAVFKVSPSVIKITQAFWQLDHGDFTTAMEQLMDPLVNPEDLKYWHHKVALRSLLLQKQHNYALLYMQVKKPAVLDDEDVLSAISLFVSNNMLDEAFYFEKQFQNYDKSNKFMVHLLNECNNYGIMKSIIYRILTRDEEKSFLKYLTDVGSSAAIDLKILYYIQRSRYIEAFETYDTYGTNPEMKGLQARSGSTARDQLIYCYKNLLPAVSYRFIEGCRREQNKIFKDVAKPKPMSVFVHNSAEQAEYKSTLIFAALAKAKQTFHDSNASMSDQIATEGTPFLRTPTALYRGKRSSVQIITPKIIESDEEDGPSPSKIRRLDYSMRSTSAFDISKFDTPIVRRKMSKRGAMSTTFASDDLVSTPQSILKVRHSSSEIMHTGTTILEAPDKLDINSFDISNSFSSPPKLTPIVSGRKPLQRTPTVRFDVPTIASPDEDPSKTSSMSIKTPSPEVHLCRSDMVTFSSAPSKIRNSVSLSPRRSSNSEEIFYSPNTTLNDVDSIEIDEDTMTEEPAKTPETSPVKLVDYDFSSKESTDTSTPLTPKARRSYKKLTPERSTPVRTSLRLMRKASFSENTPDISADPPEKVNDVSLQSPSTSTDNEASPLLSRLKPRKSLSRKVLEHNTRSRLVTSSKTVAVTSTPDKVLTESFYTKSEKSIATDADDKLAVSRTKIECSDVYTKDLTSPEKNVSEKHSFSLSTVSNKLMETTFDSSFDSSVDLDIEYKPSKRYFPSNSFLDALCPSSVEGSPSVGDRSGATGRISMARVCQQEEEEDVAAVPDSVEEKATSNQEESLLPGESEINENADAKASSLSVPVELSLNANVAPVESEVTGNADLEESVSPVDERNGEIPQNRSSSLDTSDELYDLEENIRREDLDAHDAAFVYENLSDVSSSNSGDRHGGDPEMNVFEISDDLDINDGLLGVQNQLPQDDNEINVYDEDTDELENIMQENVSVVGSPPHALEENVFEEASSGNDYSNESYNREPATNAEVIEIGSTTEHSSDRSANDRSTSESDSSGYVHNSDRYDLSDSNDSRHYSGMSVLKRNVLAVNTKLRAGTRSQIRELSTDSERDDSSNESETEVSPGNSPSSDSYDGPKVPLLERTISPSDADRSEQVSEAMEVDEHEPNVSEVDGDRKIDPVIADSTEFPNEQLVNPEIERYKEDEVPTVVDARVDEVAKGTIPGGQVTIEETSVTKSQAASTDVGKVSLLVKENVGSSTVVSRNDVQLQIGHSFDSKPTLKVPSDLQPGIKDVSPGAGETVDDADSIATRKHSAKNHDLEPRSETGSAQLKNKMDTNGNTDKSVKKSKKKSRTMSCQVDDRSGSIESQDVSSKDKSGSMSEKEDKSGSLRKTAVVQLGDGAEVLTPRRMTRRNSTLVEQADQVVNAKATTSGLNERSKGGAGGDLESGEQGEVITQIPRTKKTIRLSIDPASPTKVTLKEKVAVPQSASKVALRIYPGKRSKSIDVSLPVEPDTKEKANSVRTYPAKRNLRSASVDLNDPTDRTGDLKSDRRTVKTYTKKNAKSEKSETNGSKNCEKPEASKTRTRKAASLVVLPAVEEINSKEDDGGAKATARKTKSVIENYASTRRLTRRQATIVEASLKEIANEDVTSDIEDNVNTSGEDLIDPIKLMDKQTFDGTPDPDELKVYETSPSATSVTSAGTSPTLRAGRRSARSGSNVSEASVGGASTSKKSKKRKTATGTQTTPRLLRTKATKSDVDSVASANARSTRSRTKSVSSMVSDKSDAESNATKDRKRRIVSKSNLPEIAEENTDVQSDSGSRKGKSLKKK